MPTRAGTRSALLVVDVQTGVVAQAWDRDRIVGNVALVVQRARASGVPVIWVQHDDAELERGSPGWAWAPDLQPLPGEACVHKHHNSAFEDTGLEAQLDALSVSHLVLAGAASNWCIRATAYGALERGYDLTLVSDAHTTTDLEIGPGRVVPAPAVVDDLNTTLRWLSYPGRRNGVAEAAQVAFGGG